MQRVRHANRGRLLIRTSGPVPYGICNICNCSFVETTGTQSCITPVYDTFPWLDFLPNLTLLLNIGYHRASSTGVACRQGALTLPDTWSCPTLGLACVLMSRPISPELVLSPDFWLSSKLLKQGYLVERLKSSFRKFYGRYGDLVEQYGVTLSRMLNDILTLDQQWLPYRSTFHQFHDLYTELDLHRIMSGFHGAFATGVASQQGTLTLPDTWFRPPFWDLLMLQLLRPNSSNLPCLYSTFHLEYPLVLSRFCFEHPSVLLLCHSTLRV